MIIHRYFLRYVLIFGLCCCGMQLYAQDFFSSLTFEKAQPLAASQHKLIFIQLEARDCAQCNDVAGVAFANKLLQEKFNAACVCIKVPAKTSAWKDLASKYHTINGGISLFLDEYGTIIHRYNATTSNAAMYTDQLNMAEAKKNNGGIFRSLEKGYAEGNRNSAFLEDLLIARNRLGLDTDSLLNDYARALAPDSLRSKRVILFLARLAPVLGSPADKVLRRNPDLFNQFWFSIPAEQRVAINNNIIRKSKQQAVDRKDINAAYLAATFAKSTYYDLYNAQRIYDQTMIDYFRDAGDTLKYIPMAVYYYDTYFMTIDVDSIRGIDSVKKSQLLFNAPKDTVSVSKNVTAVRAAITFSPTTQLYSNQLRNAAWSFYTATSDSAALSRALNWAKRATEFFPSANALDVYARLLYHFGSEKEAVDLEQQAIEVSKKQQMPTSEFEGILKKMKSGAERIDEYL